MLADTDIEYRLSGGASNTDPNAALGGAMSTVSGGVIASSLHNLFDTISASEMAGGQVDNYRCLYVRNSHSTDTWVAPGAWVKALSSSLGTELAIALGGEGVGGTAETVANETTAPSGETFTTPTTKGTALTVANVGPGSFFPLWVRRRKAAPAAVSGRWTNYSLIAAPANGTAVHTIDPSSASNVVDGTPFSPTAGRLLMVVTVGQVTSTTPSGWTLPTNGSAINFDGLYVWTRTAAGADTFSTTHNGSDYPAGFAVFEFPAGSAFVGTGVSAIQVLDSPPNPTLSAMTGTNQVFGAAARAGTATTATWDAPNVEVIDYTDTSPTSKYWLGLCHQADYTSASYTPSATILPAGNPSTERLTFAIYAPATDIATLRVEGTT